MKKDKRLELSKEELIAIIDKTEKEFDDLKYNVAFHLTHKAAMEYDFATEMMGKELADLWLSRKPYKTGHDLTEDEKKELMQVMAKNSRERMKNRYSR